MRGFLWLDSSQSGALMKISRRKIDLSKGGEGRRHPTVRFRFRTRFSFILLLRVSWTFNGSDVSIYGKLHQHIVVKTSTTSIVLNPMSCHAATPGCQHGVHALSIVQAMLLQSSDV